MINRASIIYFNIALLLLSSPISAQISQSQDTLAVIQEVQIVKKLPISGLHLSYHVPDTKVFDQTNFINGSKISKIIQSKAAGLLINANSYTPGASSSIILRGYRSILGNSQPQIFLDGMPIDNSEWGQTLAGTDQSNRLIDIAPDNIESIELIKSAAGRARYGLAGGNGVILIKSKRGQNKKPKFSIRTSVGYDEISQMPLLQNKYAQGRIENGVRTYRGPSMNEGASWGPEISTLEYDGRDVNEFNENGTIVPAGQGTGEAVLTSNPLDFFQTGISTDIDASVMGGTNKLKYFVAGGYLSKEGVIPLNKFNRYNFNANVNYQVTDKFSLGITSQVNSSAASRSIKGSSLNGIMLGLLRTAPTFDNSNGLADPVNDESSYLLGNGNQRSYRNGIYSNPYWTINKNPHEDKVMRSILNLTGAFSITKNLDFIFSVGNDQYVEDRKGGQDIVLSGSTNTNDGSAFERKSNYSSQNIDASFIHQYSSNKNLVINSSIGVNYNSSFRSFDFIEGTDLLTQNMVTINNAEKVKASLDEIDEKRFGAIVAFDGVYYNFVKFDASVRQDYSNRFGNNVNGFLSYGLGIGLELDKLFFDSENSNLSTLLLHSSYGRFGNITAIGNTVSSYNQASFIGGDGFISGQNVMAPELYSFAVNQNLNAEAIVVFDLGLSINSLGGRLSAELLYYQEDANNLLVEKELLASTGFHSIYENTGAIQNKGIELSLSGKVFDNKKLKWESCVAFNKNINKVTAINAFDEEVFLGGFSATSSTAITGQPYGVIIGSGFMTNETGDLIIDDQGFPFSETGILIADPNPDWTMYLDNSFAIGKRLHVSALVDVKMGGEMYCGTCATLDYFGRSERSASEVDQQILFEGVTESGSTNQKMAELAPTGGEYFDYYRTRYGFGGLSEMGVYDTSWIRLRTVSIGFDCTQFVEEFGVTDLRISAYANNFFVSTKYPGIDPETNLLGNSNARGFDYYNNPGTKYFGTVLNLSF